MCFMENHNKYKEVNHIDGNKNNNNFNNLEWCSRKHNQQHAVKNGLIKNPKGENHPSARISEKLAIKIKESKGSNEEISKLYNVNKSTVNSIKTGRSWKHLRGK